ncbi:Protein HIDE1 [Fukomys damarensis]|uniref:Protein HIDE1 n=2 Tax=Fukomys damarensis TaxID=885580 RepID=A0A091DE73_FUKDA|nr:Protein HIDE1 [Fukomys damarensis]
MPWAVLLLLAGSLAVPAPSIFLVPPYPSSQEDPIHITCTAPMAFLGANFTLYRGGHVVQLLQAPADRAGVTFNVSGSVGGEAPSGQFRCQYGVVGEHSQQQLSDLSQPVQVSIPAPTWILALSLSLAGVFLLLAVLVVFAVVARKVKVKNLQKKRERESCWAQVNYANTDLSFDNSLFAVSAAKRTPSEEDPVANLDACPGSAGPRKRPTSTSSSPEPPEFSTFRACQ